jgi:mandelate racemase
MMDVARIGGVTGWMQATGITSAADIEISSQSDAGDRRATAVRYPCAHWREYVDWADAFVEEPTQTPSGRA